MTTLGFLQNGLEFKHTRNSNWLLLSWNLIGHVIFAEFLHKVMFKRSMTVGLEVRSPDHTSIPWESENSPAPSQTY